MCSMPFARREDSMGRKPKFDYESFVRLMKEVNEKYGKRLRLLYA